MYAIIAGIVAVMLLVAHERRAQRQWQRSIKESKARAIGRKLEQPVQQHRQQPGQYDDAQWVRIRRIITTAPLRDNGRPIATLVKGGAR